MEDSMRRISNSSVRSEVGVLSRPVLRLALLLAILISITSSFDVFLILNAGGNYRFCQIIVPVLIVLAILKVSCKRPLPTLGLLPLVVWLIFQCAFIPVTEFWQKSLGYCLWLLLNLAMMFTYVQLFGDTAWALNSMLRWYVRSFALIAGFGILQFTLPLIGYPGLFVSKFSALGDLTRANGFSYEPSYFATYLLIGFVFVGSLRRAHCALLGRRTLLVIYWVTGIAIVLSFSRMGMVFLLIELLLTHLAPWLDVLKDFAGLRVRRSKVRALLPSLVLVACVVPVGTAIAMTLERHPAILLVLLGGTGISDTAAHSVLQRAGAFEETLTVFTDHPLIGRSLGGVSSAIGDLNGERIQSFEESKEFEGMSVFAEVLTASGVAGFVPFCWFIIVTIRRPLKLADKSSPYHAAILRGLVRSLIFSWAILQFNQNILRPYLWVHLAVLASVYSAAHLATKVPISQDYEPTPYAA